MRRVLLLAVSMASLALVMPAQAADVVPEEAFSWTGIHVGAGGGAGFNTYDAESDALFQKDSFISEVFDKDTSLENSYDLAKWYGFGTLEIGADYQFTDSPFLIGFLASYDFNGDTSADGEAFTAEDDGDFSQSSVEVELDDSLFVGGRLGFVFNETTLLYGLAGYTWVDGKVKASHEFDDFLFDGAASINKNESVDGWTIGAGLETMLTHLISLKLEYRHDFLDDIEWDETTLDPDLFSETETRHSGEVDFSRDTIRAVISLRFNPL
jgi:outer membrane immunogenic protein